MAIVRGPRPPAPRERGRVDFRSGSGKDWQRSLEKIQERCGQLSHPKKLEEIRISHLEAPMLKADNEEQMARVRDALSLLAIDEIIEAPVGSCLDVNDGIDLAVVTSREAAQAKKEGRVPKAETLQLKTTEPSSAYRCGVIWWNFRTTGSYHLLWNLASFFGVPYPEDADKAFDAWMAKVRVALTSQAGLDAIRAKGKALGGFTKEEKEVLKARPWEFPLAEVEAHLDFWLALRLARLEGQTVHLNREEAPKYFS